MATFEDYLKFEVTEAEEDKKQLRIIEKISLSKETEKAIKAIDKDITIIAVAQVYCPDCRATVPFLKKFSDLNSKIKIDYRSREAAKEFFLDTDERIKIPTLISYVDGKYNTFWNEFPAVVKKKMDENPENFEDIKYNFRIGKFNAEIEKELVDYLTSL
ncbi:thioredoxin family protein [Leptotrichia wadei]|jgi:thiol-disulfide isomerase/thioredoxin|uniref:thioredoxin family protein n=1 Tax=Leptotrichia wadei TaxID=157687 RepID=UPI00352CD451